MSRRAEHVAHPGSVNAGFTLVELLVVIGIIALLVSILLPSLNKARSAAISVQCQSNLRSIGQAMVIYTGNNKGFLPYGFNAYNDQSGNLVYVNWASLLINTMDPRFSTVSSDAPASGTNTSKLREAFFCPELGNFDKAAVEIAVMHYECHGRLMPRIDAPNGPDNYARAALNQPTATLKPYRISKIKNSTDITLAWDTSLYQQAGQSYYRPWGNVTSADMADAGQMYNAPYFTTDLKGSGLPTSSVAKFQPNTPVNLAPYTYSGPSAVSFFNTDTDQNVHNYRFRHRKNTSMNALFVDGHVSDFQLARQIPAGYTTQVSNLLRRNELVNP